uniref:Leucine-rich repeat-containing protein 58 n=1 Tax=Heterorhabditis bacteriophora TaxID=37862 RepID=A0A1I7WX71_HETBA
MEVHGFPNVRTLLLYFFTSYIITKIFISSFTYILFTNRTAIFIMLSLFLYFSSNHADLNLNDLGLERIPSRYLNECPGVYDPLSVRQLNISRNNFIHIPGLPTFANLISLDVSNNGLSFLPDEIGTMIYLKTLIAKNNLLEELPKTMCNLEEMEALYLSGNRIESLPPVVFNMPKLRILHLGGNMIDCLPYAIGSLSRLEILYLGGNRLRDVPATIGRLHRLSSLALCDNALETIPSTLGELRNLESLSLHNNMLKTLPTEIVKLQNLQQLSLRNNPLVHHFVHNMELEPPKLKELAGRIVRLKMSKLPIKDMLPRELIAYLKSANQCVNPRCKGVYFEACVEHIKFVDFCGKYRVPLLQFLWLEFLKYLTYTTTCYYIIFNQIFSSPKCSAATPAYVSSESSSDTDEEVPDNMKMKKVLLG